MIGITLTFEHQAGQQNSQETSQQAGQPNEQQNSQPTGQQSNENNTDYIVSGNSIAITNICKQKITNSLEMTLNDHTSKSFYFFGNPVSIFQKENDSKLKTKIIEKMEYIFKVERPPKPVYIFANNNFIDYPYIASFNDINLSSNFRSIYTERMFIKLIRKYYINNTHCNICWIEYGNLKLIIINLQQNVNKFEIGNYGLNYHIKNRTTIIESNYNSGFGIEYIKKNENLYLEK